MKVLEPYREIAPITCGTEKGTGEKSLTPKELEAAQNNSRERMKQLLKQPAHNEY